MTLLRPYNAAINATITNLIQCVCVLLSGIMKGVSGFRGVVFEERVSRMKCAIKM